MPLNHRLCPQGGVLNSKGSLVKVGGRGNSIAASFILWKRVVEGFSTQQYAAIRSMCTWGKVAIATFVCLGCATVRGESKMKDTYFVFPIHAGTIVTGFTAEINGRFLQGKVMERQLGHVSGWFGPIPMLLMVPGEVGVGCEVKFTNPKMNWNHKLKTELICIAFAVSFDLFGG